VTRKEKKKRVKKVNESERNMSGLFSKSNDKNSSVRSPQSGPASLSTPSRKNYGLFAG
jgi:hypothetical protein